MGVAEGMWKEIHAGRAPSARSLESLVKLDAPVFGQEQRVALEARLDADVLGAGPLREALELPGVSDVLVNGTRGVWVDRGCGVERIALELGGEEDVRRLAVRLAAAAGRRLDDASPYVDAVLPGGVRLHAVLPPLVDHGAHLSLRVPGGLRIGLGDLVARGAMDDEVAALLLALVRAKVSFVISGGTGTGKTTLLAALLRHVPHDERLLVVEDVRELAVEHPHVVRLEARSPNVEGVGEVPLAALVRTLPLARLTKGDAHAPYFSAGSSGIRSVRNGNAEAFSAILKWQCPHEAGTSGSVAKQLRAAQHGKRYHRPYFQVQALSNQTPRGCYV